jgi:hypothetical protein
MYCKPLFNLYATMEALEYDVGIEARQCSMSQKAARRRRRDRT